MEEDSGTVSALDCLDKLMILVDAAIANLAHDIVLAVTVNVSPGSQF